MKWVAVFPVVCACSAVRAPQLPDPAVDPGLGDIGMLPWTTRSPEGVLGHALSSSEELRVDTLRRVVHFEPRWSETDQHLTLISTSRNAASVSAGGPMLQVGGGAEQVTHVAWYLHVLGYLEVPAERATYETASGCCIEGGVSEACGDWYVTRLIWGSGRVQLLHQLSAEVDADAVEVVHAHGGTSYRVLNEMSFERTFFAYEVTPLASLCGRVAPGDEIEALAVRPPDNCWVHVYTEDGQHRDSSDFFPEAVICRKIAAAHCREVPRAVHCSASYHDGTQMLTFEVQREAEDAVSSPSEASAVVSGDVPGPVGKPPQGGPPPPGAPPASTAPKASQEVQRKATP